MSIKGRFYLLSLTVFSSLLVVCDGGLAVVQEPRSIGGTDNIKELVYMSDALHRYVGFYNYQSSIVFESDEVIGTISVGASEGWQMKHQGNRLFLKPVGDNANTNCTILTNKRVYHFMLVAMEASGLDDPGLAYEVRLKYPDRLIEFNHGVVENPAAVDGGDDGVATSSGFEFNDSLNFNYKVSGNDKIKPVRIYDNGVFTFMQFPSSGGELPAVFAVESDGYESLVNFRMAGRDTIVLEQVGSRFTLRSGADTACVFNANIPFKLGKARSSRSSLFSKIGI